MAYGPSFMADLVFKTLRVSPLNMGLGIPLAWRFIVISATPWPMYIWMDEPVVDELGRLCVYSHPGVDRILSSKELWCTPYIPHIPSTSGWLHIYLGLLGAEEWLVPLRKLKAKPKIVIRSAVVQYQSSCSCGGE